MGINNSEFHTFRWAGGKRWILSELKKLLPTKYNNYHEPFLGGGAVFLNINPPYQSFLSDTNVDLINAYLQIRNNLKKLYPIMKEFKNDECNYYFIRDRYTPNTKIEKAARFIYLNRTCYNGLYRVNLFGKFNVPYGRKKYSKLFDYDELFRLSKKLKRSKLNCCDFYETIKNVKRNDLVFLDPPYNITKIKNGFIKYNEKLFSLDDQHRLADYVSEVSKIGAHYFLTNSAHKIINDIFSLKPVVLKRRSVIGGIGSFRGNVKEFLFHN